MMSNTNVSPRSHRFRRFIVSICLMVAFPAAFFGLSRLISTFTNQGDHEVEHYELPSYDEHDDDELEVDTDE